jgi:hypothetical protein
MAECPCSQDSNTLFEIRASPWMAKRRDGETEPTRKYVTESYTVLYRLTQKGRYNPAFSCQFQWGKKDLMRDRYPISPN